MSLTIRVLGQLEVLRDGEPLELPKSKKTRALLAYLAINPRVHRRDRLCELLWLIPDDPKGALRWSLSKIRGAIDAPEFKHVVADRDAVRLDADGVTVDFLALRQQVHEGLDRLSIEELEALAETASGVFLEGLDLPDLREYQAWCVAERENARLLRSEVLSALVGRLAAEPAMALPHARALAESDPFDLSARAHLICLLNATGRREEAEHQLDSARQAAREIGPEAIDRLNGALHKLDSRTSDTAAEGDQGADAFPSVTQEVRFCVTSDNVRLAYSCVGQGPTLIKTANWLSHLEFDWESPVWRHMLRELSRRNRLVRYDERGMGLSDWDVEDISLERFVQDLETVVEAADPGRFALFGVSQGVTVAIDYAVRHPEMVSHLILYGGYAKGWRKRNDPEEIERREAMLTLMRIGWGKQNPAFRQMFSSLFIPGGTNEQMGWLNDLQRISTTPEYAARRTNLTSMIDVSPLLPKVTVPTLVIHCRNDAVVPFQSGIELAKSIPNARFKALEGENHLILEKEPAWPQFVAEVRRFLNTNS